MYNIIHATCGRQNSKVVPKAPRTLVYTSCITQRDLIPMIWLCYMAQLIFRKVDSLGGPDLIKQPFKSKVIDREVRYLKHKADWYTTAGLKMEEAK